MIVMCPLWQRVFDSRLIRTRSRSSAAEDPPDTIYANIHPLPSSTPSVPPQVISTASQRSSHRDVSHDPQSWLFSISAKHNTLILRQLLLSLRIPLLMKMRLPIPRWPSGPKTPVLHITWTPTDCHSTPGMLTLQTLTCSHTSPTKVK